MIPNYLGLILIIAAIIIACLFAKGVLIWRDVMLKQNECLESSHSNFGFGSSFKKGHKREFDCKCGKKITVCINSYGQGNTGKGTCKCGAEIWVN